MNCRIVALAAGISACGLAVAGGASADGIIYIGAEKQVMWKTVTSSAARLALDWPSGAAKARLSVRDEVDGKSSSTEIADMTSTTYELTFALPAKPLAERIVTLSIEYLDADGVVLSSASAKLGVVQGTANGSTVPCLVKGAEDSRWARCVTTAVVPIPENATNLRLDGTVVAATPDSPGWWQTELTPGFHKLTMTIGGEDVERNVYANGGGMILFAR